MGAGQLTHRITFLKTQADTHGDPIWLESMTAWCIPEVPKKATSGGTYNIGELPLRHPMPVTIKTRCNPDALETGMLAQVFCNGITRWFSVDAIADQGLRGMEYVLTCREFVGPMGTYIPARSGVPYQLMAKPFWNNSAALYPTNRKDIQVSVEVMVAQLQHPWMQRGDTLTVQGYTFKLDGAKQNTYDLYTVVLDINPSSVV